MRGYNDQLGQALFDRYHAQQVFARAIRIQINQFPAEPGALLALRESFQLPYEVADKRVARSVLQRHESNPAAGGVAWRGHHDDRGIAVNVVAGRKSEVRAPFEPEFHISDAGEEVGKLSASTFSSHEGGEVRVPCAEWDA